MAPTPTDASEPSAPQGKASNSVPIPLIVGLSVGAFLVVCIIIGFINYTVIKDRRGSRRSHDKQKSVSGHGHKANRLDPSDGVALLATPFEWAPGEQSPNLHSLSTDYLRGGSPRLSWTSIDRPSVMMRESDTISHGFVSGIPGRLITPPPSPPKQHLPPLYIPTSQITIDSFAKQLPDAPSDNFKSVSLEATPDSPTSSYSQTSASSHMRQVVEKRTSPVPPVPPLPLHYGFTLQPESKPLDRVDTWKNTPPVLPLHLPNEVFHSQPQPGSKPLDRVDTVFVSRLIQARVGASQPPSSRGLPPRDNIVHAEQPRYPTRARSSRVVVETMDR